MTKSKYFKLYELLPPELYYGESYGAGWFDLRLLETLDAARELVGGPLICNNWKSGGKFRYRGARIPACKEFFATSYHSLRPDRLVMAADVHSPAVPAEEIRKILIANQDKMPYPFRLEKDVSWVHIDVANLSAHYVYVF